MSIVQINLLSVPEGMGDELERRFANRKKAVDGVEGFEGFELLRPTAGTDRYMVVTRWATQEAFDAWLASREFQHGHAGAGGSGGSSEGAHGASDEAKAAHAGERRGEQAPAATDSELWGFEVVDLDAALE